MAPSAAEFAMGEETLVRVFAVDGGGGGGGLLVIWVGGGEGLGCVRGGEERIKAGI